MQAGQSRNEPLVANARMYSTGAAQAGKAWTSLLNWVVAHADAPLEVLDYPPPKPLDALWARGDLGCTFMCGLPYSRDPRPLTPNAQRYICRAGRTRPHRGAYQVSERKILAWALPQAGQVDWDRDPGEINRQLRSLWQRIELGPDMLPIRVIDSPLPF